MSKNKRSLAGFDDVAETNNMNVNNDINVNNNEFNDKNNNDDIMQSVVKTQKSNKKPTGIYFEEKVLETLHEITKPHGRGAQSKLVNELLKKYFIEKGLLKENKIDKH